MSSRVALTLFLSAILSSFTAAEQGVIDISTDTSTAQYRENTRNADRKSEESNAQSYDDYKKIRTLFDEQCFVYTKSTRWKDGFDEDGYKISKTYQFNSEAVEHFNLSPESITVTMTEAGRSLVWRHLEEVDLTFEYGSRERVNAGNYVPNLGSFLEKERFKTSAGTIEISFHGRHRDCLYVWANLID